MGTRVGAWDCEGGGRKSIFQEGEEDYLEVGIASHLSLGLVLAKRTSFSNRQKFPWEALSTDWTYFHVSWSYKDHLAEFLMTLSAQCFFFNYKILPPISWCFIESTNWSLNIYMNLKTSAKRLSCLVLPPLILYLHFSGPHSAPLCMRELDFLPRYRGSF